MPGKTSNIFIDDQTARGWIKDEIGRNFFVEAGAGSGKTYSLVERMTSMVKGGIDIRKICAITFTRAAAAEFYNRFQDNLSHELAEGKLDDEKKARVEDALANIDLCFMGTIDSFCNMVLTEHPALAGIPSDCRMPDGAELEAIYKKEYTEIAKGNYGEELKAKQRRFSGAVSNAGTVFFCRIGDFMDKRHAETVIDFPFKDSLDKDLEQRKACCQSCSEI